MVIFYKLTSFSKMFNDSFALPIENSVQTLQPDVFYTLFVCLFIIFREGKGREKERERNINV